MDAVIDARFERVEKALGPLIDSISKYNPSISRVSDLVLADRELQDGLRNVQRHQNNVLRIHKLKATTAGLDAQIRSTLEVLASTRKDMTATPSTVFPDRMPNPISFEELLGFARRISKTTLPPPGVTNGVDLDGTGGETTPGGGPAILTTGQDAGASTPAGPLPQTPTGLVSVAATPTPMSAVVNGGVGTPAPGTPSNVRHDAAMLDVPQQAPQGGGGGGGGGANSGEAGGGNDKSVLPELFSQWMNPHTGAIFLPWPHEDQIRMGGLAANQSLADRGIDPKGYDPAEEERLAAESAAEAKRLEEERAEAERKAMAEREARARQEMERRRAQQREMEQRDAQLRGSAGSGARSPTATSPTIKKQFQFTAFDDDDSDNSD